MKPIKIKITRNKIPKETPEERLERLHNSNLRTRIVKSKKVYDRNKFKQEKYC